MTADDAAASSAPAAQLDASALNAARRPGGRSGRRLGPDRGRGPGRSAAAGHHRHHGRRRRVAGGRRARPRDCGPGTTEAGEELFTGIGTFVRMARLLRDALRDIAKDGKPSFAGPVREASGRPAAGPGLPGQRIRPDHVPADDRRDLHAARRDPGPRLFPGRPRPTPTPWPMPGRRWSWPPATWPRSGPRDALSKLFVEGKVVVMKANPVNDYLVPYWRRALAALLEAGVLRIVEGGTAVGQHLTGAPPHRRGAHHRARTRPTTRSSSAPAPRAPGGRRPTSPCWTSRSRQSWATSHP